MMMLKGYNDFNLYEMSTIYEKLPFIVRKYSEGRLSNQYDHSNTWAVDS